MSNVIGATRMRETQREDHRASHARLAPVAVRALRVERAASTCFSPSSSHLGTIIPPAHGYIALTCTNIVGQDTGQVLRSCVLLRSWKRKKSRTSDSSTRWNHSLPHSTSRSLECSESVTMEADRFHEW